MTLLRPEDWDLHEEDGAHIDPGRDANLRRRLNRHLARHAASNVPDVLTHAGVELASANAEVVKAEEHRREVREWATGVARAQIEQGIKPHVVAKEFKINVRTLRDWLMFGHAQTRNK